MNRYILIRRLRGPALLLLIGVLALLHSAGVIPSFWRLFWPLLFILFGVLLLAERAVLSSDGYEASLYPGGPFAGGVGPRGGSGVPPYPGQAASGQAASGQATAIVPASHDFEKDPDGGQS